MLLRRMVESLGALPERQHLEQIERFLGAHPIEGARQAIAQTLERLRMDVALRERLMRETGAWLRAHATRLLALMTLAGGVALTIAGAVGLAGG